VSRGKPDPEGYLTAARRLGVEPAEALVVLARDFGAVEVLGANYGH
jgi:beta-phosphoglucomutase-like phosphatase (HAD superfamily)